MFAEEIMPSGTYIYFGIYGEFDPEELASEIGIAPTKSAAKHSRDAVRKLSRCSILRFAQIHAQDNDEVVNVYKLADAVYERLKDHKNQIADALKTYDAEAIFQVVLDFPVADDVSTPVLGFSKEAVKFIADIGASIDIDTYRA